MSAIQIGLGIVYFIVCIFILVVVLKQEGKQQGLGAVSGSFTDTYWSKNKGRSMEGVLKKLTVVAAILFVALSLALNLTQ